MVADTTTPERTADPTPAPTEADAERAQTVLAMNQAHGLSKEWLARMFANHREVAVNGLSYRLAEQVCRHGSDALRCSRCVDYRDGQAEGIAQGRAEMRALLPCGHVAANIGDAGACEACMDMAAIRAEIREIDAKVIEAARAICAAQHEVPRGEGTVSVNRAMMTNLHFALAARDRALTAAAHEAEGGG